MKNSKSWIYIMSKNIFGMKTVTEFEKLLWNCTLNTISGSTEGRRVPRYLAKICVKIILFNKKLINISLFNPAPFLVS